MNFEQTYRNQVTLLIETLPVLNEFECFALKGGTAINLFFQNMPRLSIDIMLKNIIYRSGWDSGKKASYFSSLD